MDSDAHFDLLIGEFDLARALLTKLDFQEDLVLNRSEDAVKKYVNRTFWQGGQNVQAFLLKDIEDTEK